MNATNTKAILKELKRRVSVAQVASSKPQFNLANYFFPKQFNFFRGTNKRFKVAVCSRRAGKTIGIIGDALDLCLTVPKSNVLYITLTRENCVEIIWPDFLNVIEEFEIPCKINHQRLSITFPNGSKFSCAGAKDKREVGKFRGRKLSRIYIDEAQNFPSYIQDMIEADLIPTLRDLKGSMLVTGTPGPLKRGFFFGISNNGKWESHTWTAFENPHMHDLANGKNLEETLEEERRIRSIDKNDPTYIRETYGIWAEDRESLVFKFEKSRNCIDTPPDKLTYIFGIDLGYNDADAIAVVGYSHVTGKVYLVEEVVERKQGITELVAQIERLKAKYAPVRMVMDSGGLGKKIQEEIKKRYAIPVEAADKNRKFEYIEMLNDDLRTGKLQAKPNSLFEDDCYLVQWDRDVEDPTKIRISKAYHSDICDAVLYAWRECNHYFKQTPDFKHPINSNEYMDELEMREGEAMELAKAGHDADWGVETDDLNAAFGED
jgi:PBSX family phage terminase large subunit